MKKIAFTICSNNYLAQAITLGDSILEYNSDWSFFIGLADIQDQKINYKDIAHPIINVQEIGIDNLESMLSKYNIIEFSTSIKPFFFSYFQKYGDIVIYFDPDIYVYNSLEPVIENLYSNSIVITPHCLSPLPVDQKKPNELDFLNSGIYNLGFCAVKTDAIGREFIAWWCARLKDWAYIRFENGMFTDQIWINLIPLYFDNVFILKHVGCNMAYWNLHERKLAKGHLVQTNHNSEPTPLIFYHFSGYNPIQPTTISKYQNRHEWYPELNALFDHYRVTLIANGYEFYSKMQCIFQIKKKEQDRINRRQELATHPYWKRVLKVLMFKIISYLHLDF